MSLAAALELATPAALWGLLAAAPILVFHLYIRRRRRVLVPFAPLLVESAGAVRREARFKRLREAASLLLRLLALACAVLSLGGVRPAAAGPAPRDLIIVLDADVTTAAREADGALRLEHGLRQARAWVRSVARRPGEPQRLAAVVSVLLAGRAPRLLLAPTDDLARAERRLAAPLAPTPGTADLGAAVAMALETAARRAPAAVVVLSARPFEVPRAPPGVDVVLHGIGQTRSDQGIVDLAIDRGRDDAEHTLRVTLRGDQEGVRERTLVARVGGEEITRQDVTLTSMTPLDVTLTVPPPVRAAWLEIGLEGEDAYPANDVVHARLASRARPSLLVVHAGRMRPYTAAVAEALAAEGLVDPERSGSVRVRDLAAAGTHDVVLVDGVALGAGALRPGAYVFLAPLAGALPFDLGPAVDQPLIWRTVPNHPLVADLDFRRAFAVRGRGLAGPGLTPLAFAQGEPVIAEGERDGVRYVVLGLDPEGSALPYQAALPLLVRKAILRLARAPSAPLAPFYRTGEVVRPTVALPGGPAADIAWSGPVRDPVLAAATRGRAAGRVDPQGPAWRVPAGATGRAHLTTGAEGPAPWTGRTGFVDLDIERSIVPARPAGATPRAAVARGAVATRWRTGLVVLAVLLLLLDLVFVAASRRRTTR